ncbi:MAG: hypothetical protein GX495_19080 [Chloroflexi bacterium]|nr:hypothetical protein [Chloroflexota bacterium]
MNANRRRGAVRTRQREVEHLEAMQSSTGYAQKAVLPFCGMVEDSGIER